MATYPATPETMPAPSPLVTPGFPARPPNDVIFGPGFGGNRSVQNFAPTPAGGGNLTLDALIARQKAAMAAQEQNMSQPQGTIMGGLGQVAGSIFNALEQRKAEREEGIANDEIANAISSIGPDGIPTSDILQTVGNRDRETMLALLKMGIDQRNNAAQLEVERMKAGAEAGPKYSDVNSMGDDFRNDEGVAAFKAAIPIYNSMKDAMSRDTPQADLNAVIALAKIFDPTSVVREGEVDTVQQTGNLPDSVFNRWKYLTGTPGSRLGADVRAGMMQEAHSRIQSYYEQAQAASKTYGDRAKRWDINPQDVVEDFAAPEEYAPGVKRPIQRADGSFDFSNMTDEEYEAFKRAYGVGNPTPTTGGV